MKEVTWARRKLLGHEVNLGTKVFKTKLTYKLVKIEIIPTLREKNITTLREFQEN
jgi:hypothetical protein